MFGWLQQFFQKGLFPERHEFRVVLYTRAGCRLCDDAWKLLRQEQRLRPFSLEAIDIDADQELREKFDRDVPVVTVNGKVRFRGRVNSVLLRRLLGKIKN